MVNCIVKEKGHGVFKVFGGTSFAVPSQNFSISHLPAGGTYKLINVSIDIDDSIPALNTEYDSLVATDANPITGNVFGFVWKVSGVAENQYYYVKY